MTQGTGPGHDVRMSGFVARTPFRQVWQVIRQRIGPGRKEEIPVRDALDRVLAENAVSEVDVPAFERSAMDGYACRGEETSGASDYNPLQFRLVGQSFPGKPFRGAVGPGEAVKIMTGAELPPGANAVVMAEYTEIAGNLVRFRSPVPPGANVMHVGEDVRRGDVLLEAGRRLRPQDLGVLASIGRARVHVHCRPTVSVIVTGNELVEAGQDAGGAGIIDSNSHTICGLVRRYGGTALFRGIVPDSPDAIRSALLAATGDIVVLSGGTSVGEEDYAPQIVRELGELAVHGVAMKPGSPFGMGLLGERPVFLLPGSPVACLITADAFVGSAIRRRLGQDVGFIYARMRGTLKQKVVSAIGRTEFVRMRIHPDLTVEKLRLSGSSVLTSTTRADGFLMIEEDSEGYPEGSEVEVYHYG